MSAEPVADVIELPVDVDEAAGYAHVHDLCQFDDCGPDCVCDCHRSQDEIAGAQGTAYREHLGYWLPRPSSSHDEWPGPDNGETALLLETMDCCLEERRRQRRRGYYPNPSARIPTEQGSLF